MDTDRRLVLQVERLVYEEEPVMWEPQRQALSSFVEQNS